MYLTYVQSKQITDLFGVKKYRKDSKGSSEEANQKFDINRLKRLNNEQRKIVLQAIENISNITSSICDENGKNWKPVYPENIKNDRTIEDDKIKGIVNLITPDVMPPTEKEPLSVRIAHAVKSFFIGIANIFGRISTQKMLDKIEPFYSESVKQCNIIPSMEGVIKTNTETIKTIRANQDKYKSTAIENHYIIIQICYQFEQFREKYKIQIEFSKAAKDSNAILDTKDGNISVNLENLDSKGSLDEVEKRFTDMVRKAQFLEPVEANTNDPEINKILAKVNDFKDTNKFETIKLSDLNDFMKEIHEIKAEKEQKDKSNISSFTKKIETAKNDILKSMEIIATITAKYLGTEFRSPVQVASNSTITNSTLADSSNPTE